MEGRRRGRRRENRIEEETVGNQEVEARRQTPRTSLLECQPLAQHEWPPSLRWKSRWGATDGNLRRPARWSCIERGRRLQVDFHISRSSENR
eukprot:150330-Hanusia_phi.AAC.1